MARPPSRGAGNFRVGSRRRGLGRELFFDDPQVCRFMRYQLIGVNHNSAPVEVRERLAIPESRLPDALKCFTQHPGGDEGLILSTCNSADLRGFLHSYFQIDHADLEPHLYEYREQEAIRHLFRVTSSLDSMIVGEAQILG